VFLSLHPLWNGGYDMDEVKEFIKQTNMQENLINNF